jgi:hypothetical protein
MQSHATLSFGFQPLRLEPLLETFFLLSRSIFFMILRILKHMHFQPRMGVLTRTLVEAGPDIMNFFILWSIVFVGYSFMGHLVFGRSVDFVSFQNINSRSNQLCYSWSYQSRSGLLQTLLTSDQRVLLLCIRGKVCSDYREMSCEKS